MSGQHNVTPMFMPDISCHGPHAITVPVLGELRRWRTRPAVCAGWKLRMAVAAELGAKCQVVLS